MKAFDKYYSISQKLEDLLAENLLVSNFDKDNYPLTLTIKPDASPEAQMALYDQDGGVSSPDSCLMFIFDVEEISMKITGRMYISDGVMNKIKGLAKKMVSAYLFGYFADQRASKNGDDLHYTGKADDADDDQDSETEREQFDGFYDGDGDPADGDETENDGAGE